MQSSTDDLIASAVEKCRRLNLDAVVRVIAARDDNHATNVGAAFDGLHFRRTAGAGTNSAAVVPTGQCGTPIPTEDCAYYYADEYGKHLRAFRDGAWVQRAIVEAERITAEKDKREEEARRNDDARRRARFTPID
jgi:hypothetical protein